MTDELPDFIKAPEPDPSPLANQVGGDHYVGMAIGPAEYCHRNRIGYLPGLAIKYLSRYPRKGEGVEDLHKAIHAIQMFIELETE